MDRRMLLALMLSFAVILIYMKVVMPPVEKTETPAEGSEEIAIELPAPTPVKEAIKKGDAVRVGRKERRRKLSTVYTKVMDVTFSDVGSTIDKVVLHRSEDVKKGPVTIVMPLSTAVQPVTVSAEKPAGMTEDAVYRVESEDLNKGVVSFGREFGSLRIGKTYSIPQQGFAMELVLEITNRGGEDLSVGPFIDIGAGGIFKMDSSRRVSYLGVDRLDKKGKVKRLAARKIKDGVRELEATRWLALRNQFFTIIIKPKEAAVGYYATGVKSGDGHDGVRGGIILSGFNLKAGETKEVAFNIYVGPKESSALAQFGAIEVIDLGWFGFLGRWILKGLNMLYGICGNYGLAIILLTVVIRLIIYPLNQKSFRSMKEMQKMQPRIAELQAKYKDDPKKKQQEMMKIYKEHGVNPVGGCLPLLLQFPILIAFFRVLQNSIELWGAPFVLWIKDLSEPDALLSFPTQTPIRFIGAIVDGQPCVLLNVLPLLMLFVFFLQQKMSTPGMATTPEQAQQQKMMKFLMPVMFGFIFYNMPSGLNLYFTVSTLLGIIQQKYMIK